MSEQVSRRTDKDKVIKVMTEQEFYDLDDAESEVNFIKNRVGIIMTRTEALNQTERGIETHMMSTKATISMQEALLQLERAKTRIQNAYEEEDNAPQIQL